MTCYCHICSNPSIPNVLKWQLSSLELYIDENVFINKSFTCLIYDGRRRLRINVENCREDIDIEWSKCTVCGITFNIIRHTENSVKLFYYRAASLVRLTRGAHFFNEQIGHSSPLKLELAITAVEPAGLVVLLVAITHCQKRPENIYFVIKKNL